MSRTETYNAGSIRRAYKRILVTGGAGFIGSHMIDFLMKDENNFVICLDSLFSGEKYNIAQWLNHPRFEFIRHDVVDPISLEVDEIYHMACPASPVFYQFDPIKTVKACVIGTMNMLDLAVKCKARILLTSTSEIYGDPQIHPQVEEYWGNVNCTGIRSCYDEGKRMAETLFFDYHRFHKVEVRVARIFNTYGPRMLENDGRVVSNFIMQGITGKALTIYGDGQQTRSFCYVSDMVLGLYTLMQSNEIGPINLGNPGEYTIKQLADMVANTFGDLGVEYHPLPTDDPKRRQPNITKAATLLKWGPTIDLEQGLKYTIDEFKSRKQFVQK